MKLRTAALLAVTAVATSVVPVVAQNAQANAHVSVSVNVNVGACVQNAGDNGKIDWTKGRIFVKGQGLPKQTLPPTAPRAQKRLTAQRAAKDDALRNLASLVSGIAVDNVTQTVDSASNLDVINTSLKAVVKAGNWIDRDSPIMASLGYRGLGWDAEEEVFTGVYEILLNGGPSVLSAVLPVITQPTYHPAKPDAPVEYSNVPAVDNVRHMPAPGAVTGLIVDCTAAAIEPAMSPKIYNRETKEEIYGTTSIDTDTAMKRGIAGYVTSLDAARKATDRVGSNPMIVPAAAAVGKRAVAVGQEDADKILAADKLSGFLKQCNVMFVVK